MIIIFLFKKNNKCKKKTKTNVNKTYVLNETFIFPVNMYYY